MDFFDLHCDTAYECYVKKESFYVNQFAVSGARGKIFDNWTQTFAIWIKDDADTPFLLYKNIINDFRNKLREKPPNLKPIFSVEGGAVLECDSDRLYTLKSDGVKFLTLTWNGENKIAGGVNSQKGLTSFGKEVIEKMNRLKIGCDLSHLNQKSFYSAIELADFPLATHSNCNSVCYHKRNFTDEQIRLICKKGGIVGLCFYPEFLGDDLFEGIYRNIIHFLDMGLENNIAIGSDFDGAKMNKNLKNISQVPNLYLYLEKKGMAKGLLNKIFSINANNYIAKFS